MPEYVDPAVEELRDSSADTSVTLLIGAASDRNTLEQRLAAFDVTIDDAIGTTAVVVCAPESAIDELCALEEISSIELDHEDVAVPDEGNTHSRQRVIR